MTSSSDAKKTDEDDQPGGFIPNRETGFAEQRRDDGCSVATLGRPAYVPAGDSE